MITKEELKRMTIKEIKALPETGDAFISLLMQDSRAGVINYAQSLKRRLEREKKILEETRSRKEFEDGIYGMGYASVCGIDEVGRGPLAGPVVAGAIILPKESLIAGVNDSKKLSHKDRAAIAEQLKSEAVSYAFGAVNSSGIDRMNILNATKHAMLSAIGKLSERPEILLIDSLRLNTDIEQYSIDHGDGKCYCIGAASIIAKEMRDDFMRRMAKKYPGYGFERNMGYGTREHIEAIKKYGLTPLHRRTFCYKFLN